MVTKSNDASDAVNQKTKKVATKYLVKNWYADRYFSVTLQRNFLFVFATVSSVAVLFAIVLIKNLYEQKGIEPYLIEVDKKTNRMTIVDQKSKEEYTASEVLKDYFLTNYVTARESYDKANSEKNNNMIRVMSTKDVYTVYQKWLPNDKAARNEVGRSVVTTITIQSIMYFTTNKVEIKFVKEFYSQDDNKKIKKNFVANVNFNFAAIDMSADERILNPLGFLVTSYNVMEQKNFSNE